MATTRTATAKEPQDRKPPARRRTAKRPPEDETPETNVDGVARAREATKKVAARSRKPPAAKTEELAAEALRKGPPDGAPAMVPFVRVPRRRRAEFTIALEQIRTTLTEQGVTPGETDSAKVEAALAEHPSQVMVLVADIEDLLAPVAEDPEGFLAWAVSAPDADLMRLFSWYVADLGEAGASPT